MSEVTLSQKDNFDELQGAIEQYQSVAEKSIGEVLKGEGAEEIMTGIKAKIHPSNRKWKGKPRASKLAKSLTVNQKKSTDLAVVINTTNKYQYLYFPDDGTNSHNHHGEQHFMIKGSEDKAGKVLKMCVENIFKNGNI
jgi:hypothetical protein